MEILIKSIIVGALTGAAISIGAVRMFKAPEVQGMGAFRTLGEMNASDGDPVSHFSFGMGFFISSAATALGTGALTQDVLHRIIPNWAAGILSIGKKRDYKESFALMGIAGAIVGALVFSVLNTAASIIPADLATMSKEILTPAATTMITYIMPLLFLWAAMDAGETIGMWALIFGGIMAMISGNALPGIIFGILCGSLATENGYKHKSTISMFIIVVVMILLIGYFRDYHIKIIQLFM